MRLGRGLLVHRLLERGPWPLHAGRRLLVLVLVLLMLLHLRRGLLGRLAWRAVRARALCLPRAVQQRADPGYPALAVLLLLLGIGRASGHQGRKGRVRVVVRGQHLRVHGREPLLLLLLVPGLELLGLRRRHLPWGRRVPVRLLLKLGHDRAPFVWELLRARARVRALEESTLVAQLGWCKGGLDAFTGGTMGRNGFTYHFAWGQARPPPGGGVGRAAVVAFPADAVRELRRGVVGVDDVVGLTRVRLCGDHGRPDGAGRKVRRPRRHAVGRGRLVRVPLHGAVGLVGVWRGLVHGRS